MDPEEKNIEENNIAPELKNAVSSELSSYMNPHLNTEQATPEAPESAPDEPNAEPHSPFFEQQGIKSKPIIRTFKSDVEDTIQSQHLSSVNIAIAENKRMVERMQSVETEQKTAKKNYTIMIISAVLVIGGILAFAIPYFLVNRQNTEPTEQATSTAVITSDDEEKINIDSLNLNTIANTLAERVAEAAIRLGSIKDFYLTTGQDANEIPVDSTKFLTLINAHTPPEILRSLKPEYMFGMHNYNGNQEFLILKIGSYANAFSGMLAWEVDLWSDFKALFALPDISQNGQIKGIETPDFQDAVYNNKNTRVVKDSSGKNLLLYSIIDNNTIVITTSADTLREIISRSLKAQTVVQ
jgi:hypothetical protein